jgi:hypothetical protein
VEYVCDKNDIFINKGKGELINHAETVAHSAFKCKVYSYFLLYRKINSRRIKTMEVLGTVAQIYNPIYLGGRDRTIIV